MTIYINADTNEYPRYEADVLLNPSANWSKVVEINPPVTAKDETAYTTVPELKEGSYWQVWAIRKLTPEELKPINPHEA